MSDGGTQPPGGAEAVRRSVQRVTWVGGVSVGFSPWFYMGVVLVLHYAIHWKGLEKVLGNARFLILLLTIGIALTALPAAWLVQRLLYRRVVAKTSDIAQRAANLSAAGLVSLTVVHTPAVFALLYYLIFTDLTISLAFELWAFATYLPMQWYVNRQIRALNLTSDHV